MISEMRITRDIYMVGDGMRGLSHELDCIIYLLRSGDNYIMVDAGVGLDNELILRNIDEEGIERDRIKYLLITHSHSDHAGGARFFQEELGLEVITTEAEGRLMESGTDEELGLLATRGIVYPSDYQYKHCKPDRVLVDGEEIRLGDKVIKVIEVPSHSPGSACFLVKDEKALFSGDVVFHNGTIGLGNWPGCSLAAYRENIHKLGGLGVEKLFPGHFLVVLRDGQKHIDMAIENLKKPWVPPAWQHLHPHY